MLRTPCGSRTSHALDAGRFNQVQPARGAHRCVARASGGAQESLGEESLKRYLLLPNGEIIDSPRDRTKELGPRYDLSQEQALEVQMQALKDNNNPFMDHGIEVCYRFANFDPFKRSTYFGRSLDLGQFERFRRVMHSPVYAILLGHSEYEVISSLEAREGMWCVRISVRDSDKLLEPRVFAVTMVQRLGGHADGFWFTESFVAEGEDWDNAIQCGI